MLFMHNAGVLKVYASFIRHIASACYVICIYSYLKSNNIFIFLRISHKISLYYPTIFFIFLPVDNSRDIKTQVLQWINQKQPLMQ